MQRTDAAFIQIFKNVALARQKTIFLKSNLEKTAFLRNVVIYGDIGKKQIFQKVMLKQQNLSRNLILMKISTRKHFSKIA